MSNKKYIVPTDLNIGDKFIEDPYHDKWEVVDYTDVYGESCIIAEHLETHYTKFFGDNTDSDKLIKVT